MFKCLSFLLIVVFAAVLTTAQPSIRQTRAVGESCTLKDPSSRCPKHSSCFALNCADSVCICNEGFWPSKDFTECLPAVRLGGTCSPSQTSCMARPPSSMTCKNSQCSCADGYAQTNDGQRCGQYFAGFGMSVVKMSRLNDTCDTRTRKCAHGLECRPYARNSPVSTCQCAPGFRPRTPLEDRVRFNTIEDCLSISYTLGCPTSSTSTTSTTSTTSSTTTSTTTTTTSTPTTTSTSTSTSTTTTTPKTSTTTTEMTTTPLKTSSTTREEIFTTITTPPASSTTTMAPFSPTRIRRSTTTKTSPTTAKSSSTSTQSTTARTRRTTTNIIDTVTLDTISISREPLVLPIDLIVPAAVVAACCLLAGILGVACACVRRNSDFTGKKGSSGPGTMSAVATAIGSGASSEIIDGSANGRQHSGGWAGAMLSPDRNVSPDIGGDMSSPGLLGLDIDGRTEADILMSEPPNTSRAAAIFTNNFTNNSPSGITMPHDSSLINGPANNNVVPALIPPLPSRHYHQQTYLANAAASIAANRNNSSRGGSPPPPPPLPTRPHYGTVQRPSQSSSNNNNNNNVNGGYYTTARNNNNNNFNNNAFPVSSPSTVGATRSLGQQSQQQILLSNQQLRSMRANNNILNR